MINNPSEIKELADKLKEVPDDIIRNAIQEVMNEDKSSIENARCCICGKEIKGVKKCENYVCDHCYNLK